MPAGPRSPGVFPLTFFPYSSPFSFLCTVDSFTLSSENLKICVLSANAHFSFFHSCPICGNFAPDVPTNLQSTLMLPSRVVGCVVFLSICLRGLPPPRTPPSENAFQRVDHCIGSFIADPSRGSPHTFGNHLIQKGETHLYPYLPGRFAGSSIIVPPMFLLFCLLKRKRRSIVLVSHSWILSRVFIVQDQLSLPKEKTANTWSTSRRHLIFHGMSSLSKIKKSFQ